MEQVQVHFIDNKEAKPVIVQVTPHVPNVGDEVRFGDEGIEVYGIVTQRVWCYGEYVHLGRCNLGIDWLKDVNDKGKHGHQKS